MCMCMHAYVCVGVFVRVLARLLPHPNLLLETVT